MKISPTHITQEMIFDKFYIVVVNVMYFIGTIIHGMQRTVNVYYKCV